MRIFLLAFAGRLAAALFIGVCALLGFGPEHWAAILLEGFPSWISPRAAQWAFLALGGIVALYMMAPIIAGAREYFSKKLYGEKLKLLDAALKFHGEKTSWIGGYFGQIRYPPKTVHSATSMKHAVLSGELKADPQDDGTYEIRYNRAESFLKQTEDKNGTRQISQP